MSNELTARRALRVWLAQHEKTQEWLAFKVGIDHTLLSRVLAGYRPISDDLAIRIERVTGIDIRKFKKVA